MNYQQISRLLAIPFIAKIIKQISLFFLAINDMMKPQYVNHEKSKNIVASPLLIISQDKLTYIHNRLK
jgi:hypothetical protein